MRYLFITMHYAINERHSWLIDTLAEEIAKDDTVKVLFFDWSGTEIEERVIVKNNVEIYIFPLNKFVFRGPLGKLFKWWGVAKFFMPKLRKSIFKNDFDVVVSFTPAMLFSDLVSYLKNKNKNINSYLICWDFFPDYHSDLGLIPKLLYKYLKRKEKKAYLVYDEIGVMSKANEEYFYKNCISKEEKEVHVLPLWGPNVFSEEQKKDVTENKQNKVSPRTAIFGGQLIPGRGLDVLLDLAKYSARKKYNIVFLIFGDGPEKERLLKNIELYSLSNVKYMGFVPRDDYVGILKTADIGLVLNSGDVSVPTYPSKAIDFLRSGVPILSYVEDATDFGVILEEEIKGGFYATPQNRERLFVLFDKMFSMSKRELLDIGNNGYEFYKNNMTVSVIKNIIAQRLVE